MKIELQHWNELYNHKDSILIAQAIHPEVRSFKTYNDRLDAMKQIIEVAYDKAILIALYPAIGATSCFVLRQAPDKAWEFVKKFSEEDFIVIYVSDCEDAKRLFEMIDDIVFS
jgi:hypothetical protein